MRSTNPKVLFASLRTSRFRYEALLEDACWHQQNLHRIIILDDVSGHATVLPSDPVYLHYETMFQPPKYPVPGIDNLEALVKPKAILNLQFTSGSTGVPKAAALTHRGMVNSARYIGRQMRVSESDRILVPVPLFHAFGLIMGKCISCYVPRSLMTDR
jgi:mevalonyl-CoA ligase